MTQKLNNYVTKKYFFDILSKNIKNGSTVLELGAGKSSYLRDINRKLNITAIDNYKPSLDIAKKNIVYDNYICGDVLNSSAIFSKKSFDYVIAFDLIEHLEKKRGYELLRVMEHLAKKAMILYTPNGFLPQGPFEGNESQRHISGWKYKEIKNLGFTVHGVNGLKLLRGEFAKARIRPPKLGLLISDISWIILKRMNLDKFCFSILCIRKISNT